VAELESDPGLECARTGLVAVANKRCAIAAELVDRGLVDEAKAILTSASLPDATAICSGVLPQPSKEQPKTQESAKSDG
jgi:hypothetical protein